MAQNKLENQIQEQLNAREIQPTEMAWDRLDSMLSVAESKNTKKAPFISFRFIGIAASFLVFLSLGILYFNQSKPENKPENNVVVTEKNNNNDSINDIKIGSQVAQTTHDNPQPTTNESQPISNKSSKGFNQNQKTTLNSINNKEKTIPFKSVETIVQKEESTTTLKKEVNSKPTYINVDELLASVEKQPKTTTKGTSIKVDANSLLSEVDGQLEQTFREKVISRIGKSYQNAKTALANRNLE